jgi:pheromone shutdown protein TraB
MRIVGVHHRHQLSIAEVEDVIHAERPSVVCVELPPDDYRKFLDARFYLETEMKIAMITACDMKAEVFLVDWEKSLLEKRLRRIIGEGSAVLWEKFGSGDIPGFLRRVREEGFDLEGVQEILVKERDAVIAEKISMVEMGSGSHIVAVLGASHVDGVRGYMERPSERAAFIGERGIEVGVPFLLPCDEIRVYD